MTIVSGMITPIGTLLAWLCLALAGCASVAGLLYVIAYAVTTALATVARTTTTVLTNRARPRAGHTPSTAIASPARSTTSATALEQRRPPSGAPVPASPSTRSHHLAVLTNAVGRGATVLAEGGRRWLATAAGDQPSAAANRRALAETTVTALCWLVTSLADLQLTYARLVGASADPSAAYASTAGGISWTLAFTFVGAMGTFAGALLATTGMAGHIVLVPAPDRRWTRRVLFGFLIATMLAAIGLALATQEEVDGIHDVALWDTVYGLLALSITGALWQGAFAGRTLLALVVAIGSGALWLPLMAVWLLLRVAQGTSAGTASAAGAIVTSALTAVPTGGQVAQPNGRHAPSAHGEQAP